MLLRSHCAGALSGKELFAIEGSRAPKTGSQPDDLEELEKWIKNPKNPFIAATTLLKAYPSLLRAGMSTNSGDELNLRHLHCSQTHCRCTQRACQRPSQTTTCTTETSNTLSMNCNWRITMVFLNSRTKGNCICATTEMSTTLTPRTAHLALHNNGHVKNRSRTAPEECVDSLLHSLHCGYLFLHA